MDPVLRFMEVPFPTWPLQLLMLVAVTSVAVICAMMIWSARRPRRQRMRIRCPLRRQFAQVTFRLDRDGRPIEVEQCSILRRGAMLCGRACLPPMARGLGR